jgi:excisionase family DNA binding protein
MQSVANRLRDVSSPPKDDTRVPDASLTPDETAECLGISRRTLDKLEAEGKITAVQVGGVVRYERAEVADFIRRNRRGGDHE